MSVVRVQKRQDRFTVLSTSTLRTASLSLKARGLWALCMSYPDDWHFRTTHLQAQSDSDGREAVQSALKELEEAGLAALETLRGGGGRVRGRRWTIYEEPGLNPAVDGGVAPDPEGGSGGETDDRETRPSVGGGADRKTGLPSDGSPESRSDRRTAHPPLRSNKQHGASRKRKNEQQHARAREAGGETVAAQSGAGDAAAASLDQDGGGRRDATESLVRRGVDVGVARGLVRGYGAEAVRRAVALYDERRRGPKPPAGPGWLVAAVRRGYAAEVREEAPLLTHAEMVAWCEANGMGRMREFEAVRQPDGRALFRQVENPSVDTRPANEPR